MGKVVSTCYIVFRPDRDYSGRVIGIKPDRILNQKPTKLGVRDIALKLNVVFDSAMFEQFLPEATVTISSIDQVMTPTVEVEQPDDVEEDAAESAA